MTSTSLWRPMSPESDIDVEADDTDVESDDVTTSSGASCRTSFEASQNSAFRFVTPKMENENEMTDTEEESPVDFSRFRKNSISSDVKLTKVDAPDVNDVKKDAVKDVASQEMQRRDDQLYGRSLNPNYTYAGHMMNQNHFNANYAHLPLNFGVHPSYFAPISPFSLPYVTNYAAYMTMARLQLQEQQRRLAASYGPFPPNLANLNTPTNLKSPQIDENTHRNSSKSPETPQRPNSPEISSTTSPKTTSAAKMFQLDAPVLYRNFHANSMQQAAHHNHPGIVNPGFLTYGVRHRDPTKPPALKKYKCDVCGKSFSRSNTLVTHKRIHTGEKPFSCELCGRAFRQPGNLTRHRLTHTTVKPYVCLICNKAFNRASNLHTHMRIHDQPKSFNCHFCNESFTEKVDLRIHMYSHQGNEQH